MSLSEMMGGNVMNGSKLHSRWGLLLAERPRVGVSPVRSVDEYWKGFKKRRSLA
jgi:hypothetical protein